MEAMQEELLQFKLQQVWILVDLPNGKKAIGTKWVFRNKKDKRGIMIRNKARLVALGHRQEEGIDYEEVFAPVAIVFGLCFFYRFSGISNGWQTNALRAILQALGELRIAKVAIGSCVGWDKVGRHREEERGMLFCLEVRTLSWEMMNSVSAVI
ncbi:putative ribonuclease H-like domain-containing protein [Tanacetum coccineum]